VLASQLVPQSRNAAVAIPAVPTAATAQGDSNTSQIEQDQLHLRHAQQELALAAEQLVAARRLLAELGPALSRNYLDYEKRRVNTIWTQCDTAQRAVEEARGNIAAFLARKEE
jgi:hypothetical protein